MKNYILDSNILINALNNSDSEHNQELLKHIEDPNTQLYINPLVVYEVLRGVKWDDVNQYKKFEFLLKGLSQIDLDCNAAYLAGDLFRYEKKLRELQGNAGKRIDKHSSDILIFCSSKVNDIPILSLDQDMKTWEELYTNYLEEINSKVTEI